MTTTDDVEYTSRLSALQAIGASILPDLAKCSGPVGLERLTRHIVEAGYGEKLVPHANWLLDDTMGRIDQLRIVTSMMKSAPLARAIKPRLAEILDQPNMGSFQPLTPFLSWDIDCRKIARAARTLNNAEISAIIDARMPTVLSHVANKGFAGNYAATALAWYGNGDDQPLSGTFNRIAPSLKTLLSKPLGAGRSMTNYVTSKTFIGFLNAIQADPAHQHQALASVTRSFAGTVINYGYERGRSPIFLESLPLLACVRDGRAQMQYGKEEGQASPWLSLPEKSDKPLFVEDLSFDIRHDCYGEVATLGTKLRQLFQQIATRPGNDDIQKPAKAAVHALRRYPL